MWRAERFWWEDREKDHFGDWFCWWRHMKINHPECVLCQVGETPDGWLLTSFEGDRGECLYLIDDASIVEVYSITREEFETFPGMPTGWDIPF